jgi:hypothetical protein
VLVNDYKCQFSDLKKNVEFRLKNIVHEEVNAIDGIMKVTAERYKDLER